MVPYNEGIELNTAAININETSEMAQSPPTALEPLTNISIWDECFVNLMVWLTAGGQKFGHGAENRKNSEHSPNKHTGKVWNEQNENLFS